MLQQQQGLRHLAVTPHSGLPLHVETTPKPLTNGSPTSSGPGSYTQLCAALEDLSDLLATTDPLLTDI